MCKFNMEHDGTCLRHTSLSCHSAWTAVVEWTIQVPWETPSGNAQISRSAKYETATLSIMAFLHGSPRCITLQSIHSSKRFNPLPGSPDPNLVTVDRAFLSGSLRMSSPQKFLQLAVCKGQKIKQLEQKWGSEVKALKQETAHHKVWCINDKIIQSFDYL